VRRKIFQDLEAHPRCGRCEKFGSAALPLFSHPTEVLICQRCRDHTYGRDEPAKERCRRAVTAALRAGTLVKPRKCQGCGDATRLDGHHASYAIEDALAVVWLCRSCHKELHCGLVKAGLEIRV